MVASASEVEYVLAKAPRTNFRWTMALENTIFWTKIPAQGIDSDGNSPAGWFFQCSVSGNPGSTSR
jgi:hypothetical protein